jgi:hypothetical protein
VSLKYVLNCEQNLSYFDGIIQHLD